MFHAALTRRQAIVTNSIVGPLTAYAIYLAVYYTAMYLKERSSLEDVNTELAKEKLTAWFRVVKYDYLAHVPSDIYLITIAGVMQGVLEGNNTPIFWAVVTSQFADDFITFLKEPAIWGGAKRLVAWETERKIERGATISQQLSEKI